MRFTLARELGMTVAELGQRMSARELVWWQAFYAQEAAEHEKSMEEARRRR